MKIPKLTIGAVLEHKHMGDSATPKYWTGAIGDYDDFGKSITDEFIDGATRMGPWAIMSPLTYRAIGMGLGLGKGQRYRKQKDGRWLKVEG